jgi:hypothetical protein
MGSDRRHSNGYSKGFWLPAISMSSAWAAMNLLLAWLMGREMALAFFLVVLFLLSLTALLLTPALLVISEIRSAEDLRRWRKVLVAIWMTSLLASLLLSVALQSAWMLNE